MENIFTLTGKHSGTETKPIIDELLKNEAAFAFARFKKFEKECGTFEKEYDMNSEQFFQNFENGKLGDDLHWFDWYAAFRGKKLWEKKYHILKEITWKG